MKKKNTLEIPNFKIEQSQKLDFTANGGLFLLAELIKQMEIIENNLYQYLLRIFDVFIPHIHFIMNNKPNFLQKSYIFCLPNVNFDNID